VAAVAAPAEHQESRNLHSVAEIETELEAREVVGAQHVAGILQPGQGTLSVEPVGIPNQGQFEMTAEAAAAVGIHQARLAECQENLSLEEQSHLAGNYLAVETGLGFVAEIAVAVAEG
jgi:hypothetical protein